MIFQTLDDKKECAGIYYDGELYFNDDNLPSKLEATWKYVSSLEGLRGIKYANLYVQKSNPAEVCPDHLKNDWEDIQKKMENQRRAMKIAKVDTSSGCIWDLIPPRTLKEFCEVKSQITNYILNNFEKPANYEHMSSVSVLLQDIKNRRLSIDVSKLDDSDPIAARFREQVLGKPSHIDYDQFGTKTGRLSTRRSSFPMLTINKKYRNILKPKNHAFYEIDFNGAEIRVLLGLLGHAQPEGDIHTWNVENIFDNNLSRDEAKTAFFAWLYGSRDPKIRKHSKVLEQFYNKDSLLDKYWDRKTVITDYGRTIKADEHHALNFIVQSTAADLCLEKAVLINKFLKERAHSSHLAFVVHDSIVIDFDMQDRHLLSEIREIMSDTRWGKFEINTSIGRNYGEMKRAK